MSTSSKLAKYKSSLILIGGVILGAILGLILGENAKYLEPLGTLFINLLFCLVEKTDDAFLVALQNKVLADFYAFLNTGTLTGTETTWQRALAMAKGKVLDKFSGMDKDVTEVVGFANILDAYEYLGDKEITVQTAFGINYVENFLGYSTLFLLPAKYIAHGKVIAIPVENIDLYYIDPGDSDFARLGLNYTVKGETNLIGVHVEGDYSRATGDMYALMGMKLWAEYLDGIAVITVSTGTGGGAAGG